MDFPSLDDQIVIFTGGVFFLLSFIITAIAIRVFRKIGNPGTPDL